MLKLYQTATLSDSDAYPVSPQADPTLLTLQNILLELRVLNEYIGHQAATNGPVDLVRADVLQAKL